MTNPQPLPVIVDRLPEITVPSEPDNGASCNGSYVNSVNKEAVFFKVPVYDFERGPVVLQTFTTGVQTTLSGEGVKCEVRSSNNTGNVEIDLRDTNKIQLGSILLDRGSVVVHADNPETTVIRLSNGPDNVNITPNSGGQTHINQFSGGDRLTINDLGNDVNLNLADVLKKAEDGCKIGEQGRVCTLSIPTASGNHAVTVAMPSGVTLSSLNVGGDAFSPQPQFVSCKPPQVRAIKD